MVNTTDKFCEKFAQLTCWILFGMKSTFDYITDSKTKRKYYERYWKELLERK